MSSSIHEELNAAMLRHGTAMHAVVAMNARLAGALNNADVTVGSVADLMYDAMQVTNYASQRAREVLEILVRMGASPRD